MKNTRGFGLLPVLVIVAVLLAGGTYYYFQNQTDAITPVVDVATSTPKTQTARQPASPTLPVGVGKCVTNTVSKVDTRLRGTAGSGSAITYANGGYQVSFDTVAGIEHSRVGDQVNLCVVSVENCPRSSDNGTEYSAKNMRTGETWTAADSAYTCHGAPSEFQPAANPTSPAATIDAVSLTNPQHDDKIITGTAKNVSTIRVVAVIAGAENSTDKWDFAYDNALVRVLDNKWSITIPAAELACNQYDVVVYGAGKTVLAKGTFTGVCGD